MPDRGCDPVPALAPAPTVSEPAEAKAVLAPAPSASVPVAA